MTARRGLRPRDRRALLIASVLIGGMVIASRLVPALAAREESLVFKRERIARDVGTARMLAQETLEILRAADPTSGAVRSARDLAPPLLVGLTALDASAALVTRLGGIAEYAGVTVLSATIAGDSSFVDEHAKVGVRLSLALDDVALVRFVSAIEADPAHLAIASLHVVREQPSVDGVEARGLRSELLVMALARRTSVETEPARVATR